MALEPPQELVQQHDQHENVVFLVSRHDGTKKKWTMSTKIDFWPKNIIFWPKKGYFGQLGPKNGLLSGQTATYRKPKAIQSYLRMWGSYDPIEPGPSDPQKWGLYGCSVKKNSFEGQFWAKNGPWTPPGACPATWSTRKCCLFGVPSWWYQKKMNDVHKNWFLAKKHHFLTQKGLFWAIGAKKWPAEQPNGHIPEYRRYPELPQDMGDLWSHWFGSIWPQKMGVIWA